jgi:ABC-2 type transport system permease protein
VTDAQATADPNLQLVLGSLLRADFIVVLKNRRSLVLSILLPVILLLITNSERGEARYGGSLVLVGLAITTGLLSTSVLGYALTTARDREQGVFQRLRVTPAPTWTIMASRLATQVAANLVMTLVVLVIGARMHHLSLSAQQYALVLLVSILGGCVFLSVGQALVGLVKSADAVNAAGRIIYMVLFIGGVLGLGGELGATLDSITRWSPVGTLMTMFAGALDISAWNSHDTLSLVASLGYIAFFAAIGIRWFQWESS